jgi:hypothetical protein
VTSGTTHTISQALLANEIDLGLTALPVDPALTRARGLVERRGRVYLPALKVARQALMALGDADQ